MASPTTPAATADRAAGSPLARALAALNRSRALVAVIVLLLFNALFTEHFLSVGTFNALLTQVATTVILGVGMTLVIATGGIDLSVGSLMAIAAVVAPLVMTRVGGLPLALGLLLTLALPMVATGLCGLFNGTLVTRVGLQPIIATLVLYLAGRGIAQVMVNGALIEFRNLNSPIVPYFEFLGTGSILGVRFQIILMLLIVAVGAWVLAATTFGRYVLAIGGNEAAARLAGVPVRRVLLTVYVVSGALAGIAGMIVAAINQSSDPHQVGLYAELDAIAAVAVGGTPLIGGRATMVGTLLGALTIQLLRFSLIAHNIPDGVARVAIAAAIIVAVLLQREQSA